MIITKNLTKKYDTLTAVEEMSFSVEKGEVLGFLGPNAAGKSTTMKMIAGFVTPTSGMVSVNGFDVSSNPLEAKACIGYLPEGAPSYGEMTPYQFLAFIAQIRGLKGAHAERRLTEVLARLHLEKVLHQPIETLSKGYKRRVGLAQAIIHDPEVLILDEPTDGLDPNQKHEVRALINEMAKDKLIIVSTHILEEVGAVCSRAIIIANGKIVADSTPNELQSRSRYYRAVTVDLEDNIEFGQDITQLSSVSDIEKNSNGSITAIPKKGQNPFLQIEQLIRDKKWKIKELLVENGRMDEVFRTITLGDAA